MSDPVTTDYLKQQIEAYRSEKAGHYDTYAAVLKRTLERACAVHLPEAVIQARPKSVDSFAEKCVRKAGKYKDPIHDMTDLCGARVIVQTLDHVNAVRVFIKANFEIAEEDVKGETFADAEFGYRDVHYIIRLRPDRCAALGVSEAERDAVGTRRAEVQVRTWMQHAWADTLHDRMYKTRLKYPREFRRVAGLLAALMEDGDRSFNALARAIDGMLANYNAYAPREHVAQEERSLELILANIDEAKRPKVALQLAGLASAKGDYAAAVRTLQPHADRQGPLRPEILLDLGFALCKRERAHATGPDYTAGVAYLEEAARLLAAADPAVPLKTRRQDSLLARAMARKAWALEPFPKRAHEARACYQAALEREPGNPYHLSDVIGHEIHCLHQRGIVHVMRASIRAALDTCREHVENGTEMPFACFAAGRLHLLLEEDDAALNSYARGLACLLSGNACCAPDALDTEEEWLLRVVGSEQPKDGYDWALRLLGLARRLRGGGGAQSGTGGLTAPVLLVAGGAATLNDAASRSRITAMLARVFTGLRGTVISGGTDSGVPGCTGAAAAALGPDRAFTLIGYRPRLLPDDATADKRYDRLILSGEDRFTPAQVIHCWEDLLDGGIAPDEVRVLGYGGGSVAAFEYRLALALGASVGAVESSGGTAEALLRDAVWSSQPNLLPLPDDPDSVRAFAHPAAAATPFAGETLEAMAQAFHANYVAGSQGKLPAPMRPWQKLEETFKTANREQARYAVKILESCGFVVQPAADPGRAAVFDGFTDAEVERMAELEHGRWNVERLRDGWRRGPRDDQKKRHPCLVPWDDKTLTEEIKDYDRNAVRKFPEILAQAGLEVRRGEAPSKG